MTYDLRIKQSIPNHPKDKSGVCFVVGSHPCVDYDIEQAASRYTGADVCAVNDAAHIVPANYIATVHPEKIEQFIGDRKDIEIHSRHKMKRPKIRDNEYIWDLNIGGGSSLFAVGVMLALGYTKVIMCGCPMIGGGGYAVKKHNGTDNDPRIGDMKRGDDRVLSWHEHIRRFKEENNLSNFVRSMSGATENIFGGI